MPTTQSIDQKADNLRVKHGLPVGEEAIAVFARAIVNKDGDVTQDGNDTTIRYVVSGGDLVATANAAAAGDTIVVGPGTFNLGAGVVQLKAGCNLLLNPSTLITGTATLTSGGALIQPGNNSTISGGTIQCTGTAVSQAAIGCSEAAGQSVFTGVKLFGVTMIGDTDCLYFNHTGACTLSAFDCTFISKWDAVATGGGASVIDLYGCKITNSGVSAVSSLNSRGVAAGSGTINMCGGSVKVANDATNNFCLYALGGVLNAVGVLLSSASGSNAAYDAGQISGTLQLAGCSYDGSKTTGTITDANVLRGTTIYDSNGKAAFAVAPSVNPSNLITVKNAYTTNPPEVQATGPSADISLSLVPKGTGKVRFGTRSAIAAETVTGYILIEDSGGTVRKLAVVS